MKLRIGIAADHQGFHLKEKLRLALTEMEFEVRDYGAYSQMDGDDYPKFVIPLAKDVAGFAVDRGIAICGTGIGANIAANKVLSIRASVIHDAVSAHQGVVDDDMNIICLGSQVVAYPIAIELVKIFLASRFSELPRHQRRLEEISNIERTEFRK